MADEPWSFAECLQRAEIVARGGGSIEDIQAMAKVTRERAVLVWFRVNSNDGGAGLRKGIREDADWLRNCTKELARKAEEE